MKPCLKCYNGIDCVGCKTFADGKKWNPKPITGDQINNLYYLWQGNFDNMASEINKHFGLEEENG